VVVNLQAATSLMASEAAPSAGFLGSPVRGWKQAPQRIVCRTLTIHRRI
jgi:hypothetical protein